MAAEGDLLALVETGGGASLLTQFRIDEDGNLTRTVSTPIASVANGIATLALNRPEKRNAMSDAMRSEFIAALEHVSAEKSIRALVLTGNGKGFCAGGDIAGMERRMSAPTGEIAFNGWHRPQPVLEPHEYATLLYRLGFEDPVVRLHIYPHVLAGPEEVVEWMKGTLLTEYQRQLPVELRERFVDAYRERMLHLLGNTRPLFFPFRRILCWGQRSG